MFRDQMINFLQAVIVFLLMTNAMSAAAAIYAMWIANGAAHRKGELSNAIGRKLGGMLRRVPQN
jgi:hypothetical protein